MNSTNLISQAVAIKWIIYNDKNKQEKHQVYKYYN